MIVKILRKSDNEYKPTKEGIKTKWILKKKERKTKGNKQKFMAKEKE